MRRIVAIVVLSLSCGRSADEKPREVPAATPASDAAPGGGEHQHHREDRGEPAAPAVLALEVDVDGTVATWRQDVFDKVPKLPSQSNSGETRDVWSLRALVESAVGPGARVTAVTGEGGTVKIAPEEWAESTRTPILHTTRRGTLKFRWTDANGEWEEAQVKDVSRLEIAR